MEFKGDVDSTTILILSNYKVSLEIISQNGSKTYSYVTGLLILYLNLITIV